VGASITASLKSGSTLTLKDTAVMPANGDHVLLINLPVNSTLQGTPDTFYQLAINKTGYTVGAQPFALVDLVQTDYPVAGTLWQDNYSKVSVPPNTNLNLVLDWNDPNSIHPNLDLYVWLPFTENGGKGGIIGHNTVSGNANGAPDLIGTLASSQLKLSGLTPFLGAGTLLAPLAWGGSVNDFSPYAIHNFNGEIQVDTSDNNPAAAYYPAMESISILGDKLAKPSAKAPMLKPFYDQPNEMYTVMVADNNASGSLISDPADPGFIAPILRVWAKGYLVTFPTVSSNPTDPNYYGVKLQNGACDVSNAWWTPLTITGSGPSTSTPNTCSSNAGSFPNGSVIPGP